MNFRRIFLLFFLGLGITALLAGNPPVKAKIGIMRKAGDKLEKLKAKDHAKSGEQIRVFVQPQQAGFVYVIYVEEKEVTLLNPQKAKKQIPKDKVLVLPSNSEYFQFDNASQHVNFTIICSATAINDIEELFKEKETTTPAKWTAVEDRLNAGQKGKINVNTEKPFTMAGNVRGANDDFVSTLPVFNANGSLIRKYEIEVKK